jgi:uncharacterized membrane protein YphA (DoxX/SURF4 family)
MTKNQRIIFWALKLPVALLMLFSAFSYLSLSPEVVEGMTKIGFPLFFLKILAPAKILGALALLYPRFPTMTEWAYAGFTFVFIGAAMTHYFVGDPVSKIITPLVVLAIHLGSYRLWRMRLK